MTSPAPARAPGRSDSVGVRGSGSGSGSVSVHDAHAGTCDQPTVTSLEQGVGIRASADTAGAVFT